MENELGVCAAWNILWFFVTSTQWCDSVLQKIACEDQRREMQGWYWVKAKKPLATEEKKKKNTSWNEEKRQKLNQNRETDPAQCMTFSSKRETDRVREGEGFVMKPVSCEPGCQQYVDSQYGALFV